jgi:CRISPR-associated endoribonuclease Cas6
MKYNKIKVITDISLPYKFIGSTIRGALGWNLKRVVCINPSFKCEGCFAKDNCLYFDMYERDFAKFRLSLKLGGEAEFEIFLFEDLCEKTPYLLSAVHKMFERGITKNNIKPSFLQIYLNDTLIYDGEFKQINNTCLQPPKITSKDKAFLKIITPIRIKENNKFVREDIKLETILRSIHHRFLKLQNKEITKLPFTPKYEIANKNLSFNDFSRYSNRQKTKMKLGGVIGSINFSYIDEESFKLLKLGEIIGVGKQVTFGLGCIKVF